MIHTWRVMRYQDAVSAYMSERDARQEAAQMNTWYQTKAYTVQERKVR